MFTSVISESTNAPLAIVCTSEGIVTFPSAPEPSIKIPFAHIRPLLPACFDFEICLYCQLVLPNGRYPTLFKLAGIFRLSSLTQAPNATSPIVSTPSGNTMLFKAPQPLNAPISSVFKLSGN